jgi:carbon storage regulator
MIGDSVVITVLSIEGDKVKLGIKAPREISILRQEIFEAVQEQNRLEKHLSQVPEPESFKALREMLASHAQDIEPDTSPDSTDEDKPAQQ